MDILDTSQEVRKRFHEASGVVSVSGSMSQYRRVRLVSLPL